MPTEELFGRYENNQQNSSANNREMFVPGQARKAEQGIQQLLATLPNSLSLPLQPKYVDAFVKIFMGQEAFEALEGNAQELIKQNFEEKLVKLCLLISGMISGLPLPEDFPDNVNIDNLMNN